ncbi:MAG TPA: endonuclease/exonuclease/phosphatase family protein, partial [Baekduia sp.]|nr:endonuclease/exonuclease/phosphatase family protein [Baekduia sp.]
RWDVALLQEVPPWWAPRLARDTGARAARTVLTSRNACLCVRRAVADRRPDLIKSNGGGANVILVRGVVPLAHRTQRLRRFPERRWVHAVELPAGWWVGNLHAQVRPHTETRKDIAFAAASLRAWAGDAPHVVLGGDFNVRDPQAAGFARVPGGRGVDHLLARGAAGRAEPLRRDGLSDHAPIVASLV